ICAPALPQLRFPRPRCGVPMPRAASRAGDEKKRSNFCEYFDFAQCDWPGSIGANKRLEEAKGTFNKLFGE
ncbi:hypothetical protein OAE67_00980, partial [bacterium]|nr:hypothetical protein [bacterium]